MDLTEDELLALDPKLSAKVLRRFSYWNVFYKHVRSGYTHEYHTTDSASAFPQDRRTRARQLRERAQAIGSPNAPWDPLRRRLGRRSRRIRLGLRRSVGSRTPPHGSGNLVDRRVD